MRIELRILLFALVVCGLTGCVTDTTRDNDLKVPSVSDSAEAAARVHTELGQRYMEEGNLEGALAKLKMALAFDPNYVPAHTVIALVYEQIHQMPEAEAHYRQAVQLDPRKGDLNNNLGAFLCRVNRPAEALPFLYAALADPFYRTPAVAWTNRGICDTELGAPAAAETDFRHALETDPTNAYALYHLAELFYKGHDPLHAEAFLQRLDGLGRPDPDLLRLGYQIELQLGHVDLAKDYASRLRMTYPDSPQAHSLDVISQP
ncbi:type IV pilus biogenesis/stability protein PilW [Frateuria aurantia]